MRAVDIRPWCELLVVLLCLNVFRGVTAGLSDSCTGRCDVLQPGADCQCISWCRQMGDCCSDYDSCHSARASALETTVQWPSREREETTPATSAPATTWAPATTQAPATTRAPATTTEEETFLHYMPDTTVTTLTITSTLPPTTTPTTLTSTTITTITSTSVTTVTTTTVTTTTVTVSSVTETTTATRTTVTTLTTTMTATSTSHTRSTTATSTSKTRSVTVTSTSETRSVTATSTTYTGSVTVTSTSATRSVTATSTSDTRSRTTTTMTRSITETATTSTISTTTLSTTLSTTTLSTTFSTTTFSTTTLSTTKVASSIGAGATTPKTVKPAAKPSSQVASFANLVVSGENCQMGLEETKVEVEVGGTTRSALLSLPSAVFAGKLPLWLVFHGTDGQATDFLRYSGLDDFSRTNHVALVVPQALPNSDFYGQSQFNVGLHSQREDRQGVHDVELTRAVLEQVMRLPCIDVQRIHCTGYSNGARFCIRLASELPGLIASVAPISGLRYPSPNNASRAIPILAFHGDADPVNPWGGHGLGYWQSSVPASLQRWARFNRCSLADWPPSFREHQGFAVASYEGCQDDATVKLIRLHGAGHQWPNAASEIPNLGKVARIDANRLIYDFFDKHRLPDEWSILQLKMQAAGAVSVEQSSPRFGALLWAGIAALGPLLFWILMARRRSECCRDTPRSELGPLLLADVGSPSHAALLP